LELIERTAVDAAKSPDAQAMRHPVF